MQGDLKVMVVGRASNAQPPDIEVPASNDTVGRRHLEITLGNVQECYVVDLGSANGTYVGSKGQWKRIQQTAVLPEDPIRLGDYETSVAALLALMAGGVPKR